MRKETMTHSHTFGGYAGERPITRHDLKHATRIVVKMGTSVVSTNGEPALGRIASIVEQVCMLKRQGKEVLLVTSGSVGIGRKRLNKQILLSASLRTHVQGNQQMLALEKKKGAMAAAGQVGLMSLYETLFSLYDVACSQVLVTASDFKTAQNRANMRDTMLNLLELDVVPIVNENDAVSASPDGTVFTDNDSLAALVGGEIEADLLMLLTDVEGLYNKPPSQPGAKVISVFRPENNDFKIGEKSSVGRGGMGAKIEAAQSAISQGVNAVIIASGFKYGVVNSIMKGASLGTLLLPPAAGTVLGGTRQYSVPIADELKNNSKSILNANRKDLQAAQKSSIDEGLIARLKLSEEKLETLADGIGRTELASGLVLHQETASIGVLLVIFESRPDSLPQIAALALRSGNGLLLKGGKEALHSNAMLHKIIVKAVEEATNGKVKKDVIGCYIKKNTRIPVLGHAEGVCHMYIHSAADVKKAIELAIDAKTDYPAACNALESLLLDESLVTSGQDKVILVKLEEAGINLHMPPTLPSWALPLQKYGSTDLTIEVVNGVSAAIAHINQYSSGHTECIVTEDAAAAERFQQMIDSACVFHNASTRFADGYRFGLGAEVGISTGRIHARGPVGVEGLLTTKWKLVSESGHTVSQFSAAKSDHPLKYTHKKMELIQKEANVARPRSSRL
ncbi:Gamma-glutamyl phosphate reductase GPR, conserved site [Phytophthora cactorum]|nr:Gamma-glutamyl phosphate reductase GPR, conserved site [Phytophthora cactorum]